jgi:4-hydroxybenzoate polyprenyltransferase
VTAFAAGWAGATGLPPSRVLIVAGAVLTGQLSIGWCNDWADAPRDTLAARRDKPVAQGLVGRATVGGAAVLALLVCIALSLALGLLPGVVHLVAVASAWAYDLGVKATLASPLPYAFSFGLLPAVATTALPSSPWPAAGVVAGAALLGVGAHFANTVADTAADAATGVRGLPQRVGARRSLQVSAVSVAAAALALLTAASSSTPVVLVLLVLGALVAAAVAVAGDTLGRRAFRLVLLAVALVIAGFLLST